MLVSHAKFCRDCRYIETRDPRKLARAHCLHPQLIKMHRYLVDGNADNVDNYEYATVNRISPCGLNGQFWEDVHQTIDGNLLSGDQPLPTQKRWFSWFRRKIKL